METKILLVGEGGGGCGGGGGGRGGRASGRRDVGFAIRMVLGLGDGAGGGEEGAGVGGNRSSGMDSSKKITKRYPGRGRVYPCGGF